MNANLFGAEEEQPRYKKGLNIVRRIAKPLVIGLSIARTGYEYTNYATKECGIDKYPHAERWFRSMDNKYPVANLKSAELCEGNQWLNSGNRIFTHPGDLQLIEQIYDKKMKNVTLSEYENNVLNLEEFLLLHEAGHRKNSDTSLGSLAADLTKKIILAEGLNFYTQNYAHTVIASATAYGLNKAQTVDHALKMETRADKFACDHAVDTDVLQGGLIFFNHQTTLGAQDDVHPHSQLRAQKVLDEINRRNTCPAQNSQLRAQKVLDEIDHRNTCPAQK